MPSINTMAPRQPLAFRVGVSGALNLPPASVDLLRQRIKDFLSLIVAELSVLADESRQFYAAAPENAPPFSLRLVSPLAEGADRLVAEEAKKFGIDLQAPLPFPKPEYETDFPATVGAFRHLLERAEVVELDGAHRFSLADLSYLEVGRFVVRNCDIMIAVWDGLPARGQGGTGDVVQFAAQFGTPVWHIDVNGLAPPKFIASALDYSHRDKAPTGDDATDALNGYLRRLASPPASAPPSPESAIAFLAHHWRRRLGRDAHPLEDFLNERPLPARLIWRSFDALTFLLSPLTPNVPDKALSSPVLPAEKWWRELYAIANAHSLAYRDRYRSSYVLIAVLAIAALSLAALAGLFDVRGHKATILAEAVALSMIGVLIFLNYERRWHERWISYRLLAEICRKQGVLSCLGFSLPRSEVVRLALEGRDSDEPQHLPRELWVAWYFAAALRAAPPLAGSFAEIKHHAFEVGRELIVGQNAYHELRRTKNRRVGHRLALLGELFFALTFLLSVTKFFVLTAETRDLVEILGVVGAVVSATSGAFVGVRAYSEFSLLARESNHMLNALKETAAELDSVDVDAPLASSEIGRILFSTTTEMMQDIAGWAQLFRVKNVEAG